MTNGTDSEIRIDMTPRLEAAAREVADAREALAAAIERRDGLVQEAVDHEGMSTPRAARAAGISQTRVMDILAKPRS